MEKVKSIDIMKQRISNSIPLITKFDCICYLMHTEPEKFELNWCKSLDGGYPYYNFYEFTKDGSLNLYSSNYGWWHEKT